MAQIIEFPKKHADDETPTDGGLRDFIRKYVYDLTQMRRQLVQMETEMKQLRKARLRLVTNGQTNRDKPQL